MILHDEKLCVMNKKSIFPRKMCIKFAPTSVRSERIRAVGVTYLGEQACSI